MGSLAFGALWAAGALFGFGRLFVYDTTPGPRDISPAQWPATCPIHPRPGLATIVMGVHPQCPCTRASLAELARIMAEVDGRLQAHVLFFAPPGMEPGWVKGEFWRAAKAIPGVSVSADGEGLEAARFGLETSGHVLLYDENGNLRFSGGITASRGHEGDSVGHTAIVSIVTRGTSIWNTAAVFGCTLRTPPERAVAGGSP